MSSLRVVEYLDHRGRAPFRRWFDGLDPVAAARVAVSLYRLEQGNVSNVRGLGGGLDELRMDFGPGYRVYFAQFGRQSLLLLGGGTKRTQRRDIDMCRQRLRDHELRSDAGALPDATDP